MDENSNQTALLLIQKDLDLPVSDINLLKTPGLDELHRYLTSAIAELLDKDFNRLLNALYRIDVSEKKVAAAIDLGESGEIASTIASLVIERELKKVETRKKYSGL